MKEVSVSTAMLMIMAGALAGHPWLFLVAVIVVALANVLALRR